MKAQALVAIGGRGTRLNTPVPVSKAFLELGGKPLLHWCLQSLHQAGIRRIALAGDKLRQLHLARVLLAEAQFRFDHVCYWRDAGLGVHGLPHHTSHLLDEAALFQAGHALTAPEHLRALMTAYRPGNLAVSAFPINPNNPRPTHAGKAIALPQIVDRQYAALLPELGFNIHNALDVYQAHGRLTLVDAPGQPEFDTPDEYAACMENWRAA